MAINLNKNADDGGSDKPTNGSNVNNQNSNSSMPEWNDKHIEIMQKMHMEQSKLKAEIMKDLSKLKIKYIAGTIKILSNAINNLN